MSKIKSQSQQSNQAFYSTHIKSSKPQIKVINVNANCLANTSKTPLPIEKSKNNSHFKIVKSSLYEASKAINNNFASRSKSTGIGSTRMGDLYKQKASPSRSRISDIFETKNERNLLLTQANKLKSIFTNGLAKRGSKNFTSSKSKQDKLKTNGKKRVLDEVNCNLLKLKLGSNLYCKTGSNTRRSSKDKKAEIMKSIPVKENSISKIKTKYSSNSKSKQFSKEDSMSKMFSSQSKNVTVTSIKASVVSPKLKVSNIKQKTKDEGNSTSAIASLFNDKTYSKIKSNGSKEVY